MLPFVCGSHIWATLMTKMHQTHTFPGVPGIDTYRINTHIKSAHDVEKLGFENRYL